MGDSHPRRQSGRYHENRLMGRIWLSRLSTDPFRCGAGAKAALLRIRNLTRSASDCEQTDGISKSAYEPPPVGESGDYSSAEPTRSTGRYLGFIHFPPTRRIPPVLRRINRPTLSARGGFSRYCTRSRAQPLPPQLRSADYWPRRPSLLGVRGCAPRLRMRHPRPPHLSRYRLIANMACARDRVRTQGERIRGRTSNRHAARSEDRGAARSQAGAGILERLAAR